MLLDLFRGVVPFVTVVEEQSFRKAAARLGVSPAAVSKAVAVLEADLGHALLIRGSRAVRLTREGEILFASARPAVIAVMGARAVVEGSRREPQGQLVVSVPFAFVKLVPPALSILRMRHPRLSFRLVVTDRLTRLAEEPIDVAIRVGELPDSSLVARFLRRPRMPTVAAPSYLAQKGTPKKLADLDAHDAIVLMSPTGKPYPWLFKSGPRPMQATLSLDYAPAVIDAALAGLGLTQAFDFMVEEHLRTGKLAPVFADDVADGPPVHAVCVPGRKAAARVRAAFEAFVEAFGTSSAST
ncbi:MAG: LysR family transcriptional regulator [Polyangiaceae bacterium]